MLSRPGFLIVVVVLATACASSSSPSPKPTAESQAPAAPAAPAAPDPKPATSPAAAPAAPAAGPAASPAGMASPAARSAVRTTQVRLSMPVKAYTFFAYYVAQRRDLFAEEGLQVEAITTGGQGPDIQALIAGEVDFNFAAGNGQMEVFKQGRKLLAVFNALDKPTLNAVMHVDVARERGITTQSPLQERLRALKGLKIAGTRPGAVPSLLAEYLVRQAGYDPHKDAEIVGAGEGPALIAALENRQVDVVVTATPVPEQMVARGSAIMLVNNAAGELPSLVPFNMATVLVRPDYAEKNPEVVGRFVRAARKANEWIVQATPEQIADLAAADFGEIQRDVLVASAASLKSATNRAGVLDRKAVEHMVEMSRADVNVDELHSLFTDRFIKGQ